MKVYSCILTILLGFLRNPSQRKLTKQNTRSRKWISTLKWSWGFCKCCFKALLDLLALVLSIQEETSELQSFAPCVQEKCSHAHAHHEGKEAPLSHTFNADTTTFDCNNSATGHVCNQPNLYLEPPLQNSGGGGGILTVNELLQHPSIHVKQK